MESYSSYEKMEELKNWLFQENVRMETLKQELEERVSKLDQKERDLNILSQKLLQDQKRLKESELFFEKKLEILQDGFRQLDIDRRKFESERSVFETKQTQMDDRKSEKALVGGLFGGVNSLLALKKRYKDLMKIYHPDNLCGDSSMVKRINEEYERMRDEFDFTNIV